MKALWLSPTGARTIPIRELAASERGEGFLWLDIEEFDAEAATVLQDLGFDPETIGEGGERSIIPKVRAFEDHLLLVLHSLDDKGHLLQLDQLISERSLITIHHRFNPEVPMDVALRESRKVTDDIEGARWIPGSPVEIAYALIVAIGENLEQTLEAVAERAGVLDRRMRENKTGDPERFLEDLFAVRHDLVTIGNRAAQSRDALSAAVTLAGNLDDQGRELLTLARDRLDRLLRVCDGERRYLQEVLEYHEHRTSIKMNFAMERLALIAAIVLPINALAGIVGMNTIVNSETSFFHTGAIIVAMLSMAGLILLWTKRKGWW